MPATITRFHVWCSHSRWSVGDIDFPHSQAQVSNPFGALSKVTGRPAIKCSRVARYLKLAQLVQLVCHDKIEALKLECTSEKQFVMAKDIIHLPVKKAIEKAGWTVTNEQYTVQYAEFTMYADLAAERLIAAQRGTEKIAVEIKSFVKRSAVQDVRDALGSMSCIEHT